MTTNTCYAKKSSNKLKKKLKEISNVSARSFLLKQGYTASSFRLPEYYDPKGFEKIKLDKINWRASDAVKFTKTLDILTPKSHLSWRCFNFINPYIYLHLVLEITEKDNWKIIKELLTQETHVYSYSVPILDLKEGETIAGRSISNWLQMAERDLIKDCPEYNHLIVTDIKNFYPTIYTHSIGWSIHGKQRMKDLNERKNYNLLGNKLDKLFQNSRDGQTNGIPVGSMVSDIIAEIILTDVDNKLSKIIIEEKIKDVLIFRYRDDYRVLSKNEGQGKRVLHFLSKILQTDYDLNLNTDKTIIFNDVIEGSFRPWMVEIKNSYLLRSIYYHKFPDDIDVNYINDCLVEIYKIQKKYSSGRASLTILVNLSEYLYKKIDDLNINSKDIPEVISLLRKISLLREEVTPQVYVLLDILLTQVKGKMEKKRILGNLKQVISDKNDQDYQLIWFYRLCLAQLPELCEEILLEGKSPLLRVVDRRYYKNDFDIFVSTNISNKDTIELSKFSLINREKMKEVINLHIDPSFLKLNRLRFNFGSGY